MIFGSGFIEERKRYENVMRIKSRLVAQNYKYEHSKIIEIMAQTVYLYSKALSCLSQHPSQIFDYLSVT